MNSTMNTVNRPVLTCSQVVNKQEIQAAPANNRDLNTCHRRYDSQILFANSRLLVIQHEGSDYQLRITNQGKLILTK